MTHASDFTLDTSLGGGQGGAAQLSTQLGVVVESESQLQLISPPRGARCEMLAAHYNTFFDQPDGRKKF